MPITSRGNIYHSDEYCLYIDGYVVTPSDTADLPEVANGFTALTTGTVKFSPVNHVIGTDTPITMTLSSTDVNQRKDWRIRRIWATGTTASILLGF